MDLDGDTFLVGQFAGALDDAAITACRAASLFTNIFGKFRYVIDLLNRDHMQFVSVLFAQFYRKYGGPEPNVRSRR